MAGKMTPERQKLADAQAGLAKARQRLAALETLKDNAWDVSASARRKAAAAEAALAEGRRHAVTDMVRRQMGEDVLDRPTRPRLEADLEAAQAEHRAAGEARTEIERQHGEAERAAEQAAGAVRNAMAEVLQSAPETAALVEEARELEARLIECYAALEVINGPLAWKAKNDAQLIARAHTNPFHPDWHLLKSKQGNVLASEWAAARERLQIDATAPLPGKAKRGLLG
jgi:DNA repair exonuclease SbcCD ATPase subunit